MPTATDSRTTTKDRKNPAEAWSHEKTRSTRSDDEKAKREGETKAGTRETKTSSRRTSSKNRKDASSALSSQSKASGKKAKRGTFDRVVGIHPFEPGEKVELHELSGTDVERRSNRRPNTKAVASATVTKAAELKFTGLKPGTYVAFGKVGEDADGNDRIGNVIVSVKSQADLDAARERQYGRGA